MQARVTLPLDTYIMYYEEMIKSKFAWWRGLRWTNLAKFSHPIHFVSLFCATYIAFLLPSQPQPRRASTLISLLYVGTFATHFGIQIWMSFVSGIVLYFSLPRHIFGQVQKHLFPKYFLLNSILGFVTLATFTQFQPKESMPQYRLQTWTLAICFLSEFSVRLYLVPNMLNTMEARSEAEVQTSPSATDSKTSPSARYINMHKRFRRLHGLCACANLIAVACNTIHLYYLASRLSLVVT